MDKNVVKIFKGEVKEIELRIRDTNGDPVDLAEKELAGTLKGCPTPVALTSDDFEVLSASLGKIKMKLSADHTNALKSGVSSFNVNVGTRIVRFENCLEVVGDL